MAAKRDRWWAGLIGLVIAFVLTSQPLPSWLNTFRPDWVALVLVYISIYTPQRLVLSSAMICGLLLDAVHGTPLGQYALALTVCCYVPLKLHLRLVLVPIWQSVLTTIVILALYQFVLFWCNGATGNDLGATAYLAPLASDLLVWPVVLVLLDAMRLGRPTSAQ